jgi:hypothetical protein
MTKPQTRVRESSSPGSRQRMRFHLVREGEPVPEIAPPHIVKPRRRRQVVRPQMSMQAEPHCPLCDVVITRFDADMYLATGRCGPCHEALEKE